MSRDRWIVWLFLCTLRYWRGRIQQCRFFLRYVSVLLLVLEELFIQRALAVSGYTVQNYRVELKLNCVFSGIVRGVEMERKLYHILTPVPPEKLRLVNCLLLGNIAIPNCVLVGQVGAAWSQQEPPELRLPRGFSIFNSEACACPEMSGHQQMVIALGSYP